jgi:hypothetical protein
VPVAVLGACLPLPVGTAGDFRLMHCVSAVGLRQGSGSVRENVRAWHGSVPPLGVRQSGRRAYRPGVVRGEVEFRRRCAPPHKCRPRQTAGGRRALHSGYRDWQGLLYEVAGPAPRWACFSGAGRRPPPTACVRPAAGV